MVQASTAQILVIKHSAFGDFLLAMGPFAAIRAHHPDAKITLLTTKGFVDIAQATPYFDEIWVDEKPGFLKLGRWWQLIKKLRGRQFQRVYDLQHSDRTALMFRAMRWKRPEFEWSGIAKGCSHPHRNPLRDTMHTIERQAEQLLDAGITQTPMTPLDWAKSDLSRFSLPPDFALVCPGGAPHRLEKRWPPEQFATLATFLITHKITPVLIGGEAERFALDWIKTAVPAVIDLSNQTNFFDLVELGRHTKLAVGNDTGPMHVFAAAGAPVVTLFSGASIPAQTAPRGPKPDKNINLQRDPLSDLEVRVVVKAVEQIW